MVPWFTVQAHSRDARCNADCTGRTTFLSRTRRELHAATRRSVAPRVCFVLVGRLGPNPTSLRNDSENTASLFQAHYQLLIGAVSTIVRMAPSMYRMVWCWVWVCDRLICLTSCRVLSPSFLLFSASSVRALDRAATCPFKYFNFRSPGFAAEGTSGVPRKQSRYQRERGGGGGRDTLLSSNHPSFFPRFNQLSLNGQVQKHHTQLCPPKLRASGTQDWFGGAGRKYSQPKTPPMFGNHTDNAQQRGRHMFNSS